MSIKSCANCGLPFQPVAQVPDQTYCSQAACQRVRRQRWYQKKLMNDPDYRENKQRLQRNWMDRNPAYWSQYRADNPDYAERNRSRKRPKDNLPKSADVAKIDESIVPQTIEASIYRITLIRLYEGGPNNSWIVALTPACLNCDCKNDVCKGDACKDRT